MARKTKKTYIARIRLEPTNRERLSDIFDYVLDVNPGVTVMAPQEHHTALYAYYQGFQARNEMSAMALVEYALKRKLIKPLKLDIAAMTIEVRRAAIGDPWPANWFNDTNLDDLGKVIE